MSNILDFMKIPNHMYLHLHRIFKGEYDMKGIRIEKPVILDIGANIGAYTTWILTEKKKLWIDPTIYCYEPMNENFRMLEENMKLMDKLGIKTDNVHLNNMAVGDTNNTKLYKGMNNLGENSLYLLGNQDQNDYQVVKTIDSSELPPAHIVKIDTEGSELDILRNLKFRPLIIMLEYHSESDRREIDILLHDYILHGGDIMPGVGTLKYLRKDLL